MNCLLDTCMKLHWQNMGRPTKSQEHGMTGDKHTMRHVEASNFLDIDLKASGEERKVRKEGQGRETLYEKVWLRQRFFVAGSGGHQYACKEKKGKKWEVYSRKEQQI